MLPKSYISESSQKLEISGAFWYPCVSRHIAPLSLAICTGNYRDLLLIYIGNYPEILHFWEFSQKWISGSSIYPAYASLYARENRAISYIINREIYTKSYISEIFLRNGTFRASFLVQEPFTRAQIAALHELAICLHSDRHWLVA